MPIIAPDLLTDMRDLPLAALIVLAALGLILWAGGWLYHRFWLALITTFTAGLIGLNLAPRIGLPPIAVGLLAAAGAGFIALAAARVAIFLLYGLASWYAVHVFAVQFEVPFACVIVGGLLSMLLYRVSVMGLLSAIGLFGLAYGGLILAERIYPKFDAVKWVTDTPVQSMNLGFGLAIVGGVIMQHVVEKAWEYYKKRKKEWDEFKKKMQAAKASAAPGKSTRSWLPKFKSAA